MSKRVLVIGIEFFYYLDAYAFAFEKLGYSVKVFKLHSWQHSAKEKLKLYIKQDKFQNDYCDKQIDELIETIIEFKPDEVCAVSANYFYEFINKKVFDVIKEYNIKSHYVLIDSIKRFSTFRHNLEYFDRVFVYEKGDVQYLKNKCGIEATYMPVGVAENIYCQGNNDTRKEYDVCFVGFSNKDRLPILESVARYCVNNNLKFIVIGKYWETDHWWYFFNKRLRLRIKYPNLYKCVTNTCLINREVSDLYQKSKICLNVHVSIHKSINPRTFEILGNRNFELCDWREDMESFGFVNNENIAIYKNPDECVDKIQYFLENDEERNLIAEKGCKLVRDKYTIYQILKRKGF